ncbi:MAG: hypothetical protein Q8N35_04680 [Methylococcaceae bacterium]|nr:hypothetical protein [Methylococcaceae bacterium]MDZ4155749.1 hypothetical protein [Methylococcales bacterium]MDP2391902.1 hypothetical protein [Methylococcaceae bacterium]MDP3018859.1 hypothetical protein [Methylococcaceae bacterium]MDP3391420.1 hypothetical protein [Methylococcaceae bacterium]
MTKYLQSNHYLFTAYIVLSVIGVGISASSPSASHYYWLFLVLLFGAGAVARQYYQLKNDAAAQKSQAINTGLHWLGGLVAAIIVNAFLSSGRIFVEETGLITQLVLALTVYSDGLKTGWRNSATGVFLALAAVGAAYFDSYVWQLLALAGAFVAYSFYKSSEPSPKGCLHGSR